MQVAPLSSSPTLVYTFVAYAVGGVMGLAVDRAGPRLRRDWPIYLRAQLLATAALLTMFSAWRLTAPHQVVGPVLIAAVAAILLVVAVITRGRASSGQAALESWAANPNGAFWVLPMATALAGTSATMVSALANAAFAAPCAVCIHLMRRDAPFPQRRSTTWVDQSALLAFAGGLLLHVVGPAPAESHWVLLVASPILAFVGAALFVGSVLHPHNLELGRGAGGFRRWIGLSVVRTVWLLPIALISPSRAVAVVAMLCALGAPAFSPVQQAVLYGYRSPVVNVAARWGWLLLPVGLVGAILVR